MLTMGRCNVLICSEEMELNVPSNYLDLELGNYNVIVHPPTTLRKVGNNCLVLFAPEGLEEVGDNQHLIYPHPEIASHLKSIVNSVVNLLHKNDSEIG